MSKAPTFLDRGRTQLPLPKGEGRGEGEQAVRIEKRVRRRVWLGLGRTVPLIVLLFIALPPGESAPTPRTAVEFRTVDIFIDPNGKPLAAYQLDWIVASQNAKIVGIEGGE